VPTSRTPALVRWTNRKQIIERSKHLKNFII